jgi:hypothetical protein
MNTDAARIDTDQSVFIRAKSMFIRGRFCPGLRYNKNVIAPGAQTKRRDDAGPVRTVLGGYGLTGRFSNPKSKISNPKSLCLCVSVVNPSGIIASRTTRAWEAYP